MGAGQGKEGGGRGWKLEGAESYPLYCPPHSAPPLLGFVKDI